jgi:hypothetical protein
VPDQPKVQFRIDWLTSEVFRRTLEARGDSVQAWGRRAVLEYLGGKPNYPKAPEHIVLDVLRLQREGPRPESPQTVEHEMDERGHYLNMPEPMGPCPNPLCPTNAEDEQEREMAMVSYDADVPLIVGDPSHWRCQECGVTNETLSEFTG